MGKLELLSGRKFGRYSVIARAERSGIAHWHCVCECGNKRVVNHYNLLRGGAKSCGCLRNEKFLERVTKHSLAYHPLYQAYYDMRTRCYNPKSQRWSSYGGRGIKVCDRWMDEDGRGFLSFCEDMQPTWEQGLTIDREDVNGQYEKLNCKWSTKQAQARNKRNNRMIDTPWGRMCLQEAANTAKIDRRVLSDRIARWPQDRWFDPPGSRLNRRS